MLPMSLPLYVCVFFPLKLDLYSFILCSLTSIMLTAKYKNGRSYVPTLFHSTPWFMERAGKFPNVHTPVGRTSTANYFWIILHLASIVYIWNGFSDFWSCKLSSRGRNVKIELWTVLIDGNFELLNTHPLVA